MYNVTGVSLIPPSPPPQGDAYTEYRQQFDNTVFQTIRVYNDLPFVELDYVVGNLDIYP